MLYKKTCRLIVLMLLSFVLLLLSGAKQVTPEKPPWESGIEPVPCEPYAVPVSATIIAGAISTYTIDLDPGTYTVSAWASWDLTSVRLTVTDTEGNELGRDEGYDNQPMIELVIGTGKQVEIKVTAGDARVEGIPADFSLIVAMGSYCYDREPVPTKDILDAWTSVVRAEDGQVIHWSVTELSGAPSDIFTYMLRPGSYSVIAETGNSLDDIDMYVRRGEDNILSQDEDPDNNPVCHFVISSETEVSVEVDPWAYGEGASTDLVLLITRDAV